jgi:nucleoside-diphosphate-sugar epimerase
MKVLITGANGFVGKYLANYLRDKGADVRCAVRSEVKKLVNFENVVLSNMNSETNWRKAIEGIDVVIHLIAKNHTNYTNDVSKLSLYRETNVGVTEALCKSLISSKVQRLIFLSSIAVNGETSSAGKPFDEKSKDDPKTNYGKTKLDAEKTIKNILVSSHLDYVIIRPPLIYGQVFKGNLLTLQKAIKRGLPLPFACIKNSRSLVTLENLASLLHCCLHNNMASNKTFLVGDDARLSTPQIIKKVATDSGITAKLFCTPKLLIKILLFVLRKRYLHPKLLYNLEVDNSLAKKLLGWKPNC